MASLWIYLVVALCFSVTSPEVLPHPGNPVQCHRDGLYDVKGDAVAPPMGLTDRTSPNIHLCQQLCIRGEGQKACGCSLSFFKGVFFTLMRDYEMKTKLALNYFPTNQTDPACKQLCKNGKHHHYCICK
ncbi:UNVERIFIED_CONTAM: hypothetical protein PYX00_009865 [Menopon gallinae]|uniref:Uncharacterized protein n=1 Tax=Menopon gallinae TaxID=328185 RepID=A0AAW2HD07_9NEOP